MEYIHGGDIYRNPVEYDFSVNINPLGMPLKSIQAAHEGIVLSGRYPDYSGERLCQEISRQRGVSEKQMILGNGAAELIYALCHAVRPRHALAPAPTFQEYAVAVEVIGGRMEYHVLRETENFDLDEKILDAITEDTDILFLCNPNNPTGRLVNSELMKKIFVRCGEMNVIVCVDESFLPFAEDVAERTALSYMDGEQEMSCKLVVIRSFTKIYGMPGLRLGYLVCNDDALLCEIRKNLQPWNTSVPAQMAGLAALADEEFLAKTHDMMRAERAYLELEMQQGLVDKLYPGCANFIFFRAEETLMDMLMERGIMIRDCSNFAGLSKGYFRIGIRSHSENQMLIRRWRK